MKQIHYITNGGSRAHGNGVLVHRDYNDILERELEKLFPQFKVSVRFEGRGAAIKFLQGARVVQHLTALSGEYVVMGEFGVPVLVAPWQIVQSSEDLYPAVSDSAKREVVRNAWNGLKETNVEVSSNFVTEVQVERFQIARFLSGEKDVLRVLDSLRDFLNRGGLKPIISFSAHYTPTFELRNITVNYHKLNSGQSTTLYPGDVIFYCEDKFLVQHTLNTSEE